MPVVTLSGDKIDRLRAFLVFRDDPDNEESLEGTILSLGPSKKAREEEGTPWRFQASSASLPNWLMFAAETGLKISIDGREVEWPPKIEEDKDGE